MKFYISGKITELDSEEAVVKFSQAEERLKTAGHQVVNPTKINTFHPDLKWEDYMLKNIKELFTCGAIVMLSCWESSKGARIEHAIAKELKFHIEYWDFE